MKLVALLNHRFSGRDIKRGEVFEAGSTYTKILVKRRLATVYVEDKPKRSYNRRDMVAEESS